MNYDKWLKAKNRIAQGNALGLMGTDETCVLKGQYIFPTLFYAALSGRNLGCAYLSTQGVALGYPIFGFQPIVLKIKLLRKAFIDSVVRNLKQKARKAKS
ncbi:MAG: hypothetical protein FWC34_04580 [Bacteroidetes bacterium]|nr:hypothetical protein [Bacteroidota bacterium]MCL2303036.1 hypothetical protein [Lentimicrobiaceae bacterium]